MTKWVNASVLDGGSNVIVNSCNELRLITTYAANDLYTTIVGNTIAIVAMVPADFTMSGATGLDRVLTTALNKQDPGASSSSTSTDMHFAFCDSVGSNVLWITPESSGQSVHVGNPVRFPSLTYTSKQPI
jgi:hypothetical protein